MNSNKLFTLAAFSLSLLAIAPAQTPPTGETRAAFQKLMADVKLSVADSNVTSLMLSDLRVDVAAVIDGAVRPDSVLVKNLRAVVTAAIADKKITNAERAAITVALSKVFVSANVPASEVAALKEDISTIWNAANVTPDEINLIVSDIKALLETLPARPVHP